MQAKSQSGNVLIYVLIAVMLFSALTFVLTRQSEDDGGAPGTLDRNTAALLAGEIIDYATSVRSTVEQMSTLQNVLPNEFNFLKPGDAGFTTVPHTAKVFHPVGGGLNVFAGKSSMFKAGSGSRGWVSQQGTNVAWSKTSASDIIFTFLDVDDDVCAAINERLYKDSSVPTTTTTAAATFTNGGGDDADFTTTLCPSCNQRVSFCIKESGGANAFYNVILSR